MDGKLEYQIEADASTFKKGVDEASSSLQKLSISSQDESFARLLERARDKSEDLESSSMDLTGTLSLVRGSMSTLSQVLNGNLTGALRAGTASLAGFGGAAAGAGGILATISSAIPGLTIAIITFASIKKAIDSAEASARKFTQQLRDASSFAGLFTDDVMNKTGQDDQSVRLKEVGRLERAGDKDGLNKRLRPAERERDRMGNLMLEQQSLAYGEIQKYGKDSKQAQIALEILKEETDAFDRQLEYVNAINSALDQVYADLDEKHVARRDRDIEDDAARQKYAEDRAAKSGDAAYFKKKADELTASADQRYGKWSNDKLTGANGVAPASADEVAARRRIDELLEIFANLSKTTELSQAEPPQNGIFGDIESPSDRWSRVGAFVGGNTSAQHLSYARQTANNTHGQMLTTTKMLTAIQQMHPATL